MSRSQLYRARNVLIDTGCLAVHKTGAQRLHYTVLLNGKHIDVTGKAPAAGTLDHMRHMAVQEHGADTQHAVTSQVLEASPYGVLRAKIYLCQEDGEYDFSLAVL